MFNEKAGYALSEALKEFAKQKHRKEAIQSLLDYLDPEDAEREDRDSAAHALSRLTGENQSVPLRNRLSQALHNRLPKYHLPVPITAEVLNDILAYLFPDSDLAKDKRTDFPIFIDQTDPVRITIVVYFSCLRCTS